MERERAQERWRLLAKAVRGKRSEVNASSVRRYNGFQLFRKVKELKAEGILTRYSLNEKSIIIKDPKSSSLNLNALSGFDNTGNICIWPSEEVLAFYCCVHPELFQQKTVCELGAGSCGIGGLFVTKCGATSVHITDGNAEAVKNLQTCSQLNGGDAQVSELRWDRNKPVSSDYRHAFDVIIAADWFPDLSLFLEEFHEDFLYVVDQMLSVSGHAIILAPQRGKSLENFTKTAKELFICEMSERYDEEIWRRHEENLSHPSYEPNLHYPFLLTLHRNVRKEEAR